MPYYRSVGSGAPKRPTQHRDEAGHLYREELVGEEGFSSDSSLLYPRGVPSAIVDSQVWELPDQTRVANHPLKPRHLKLHALFPEVSTGSTSGVSTGSPSGVSTGSTSGVSTGSTSGVSTGSTSGVST